MKGIEGVSCLLSFPTPAVVEEVFYLGVGGRDTGIWHPALWMEFQTGCLVSWARGIRRGQGWKSTERGLEAVERTWTLRLKACGKCCLSSSPPSGAGAGCSTRPSLDKVLTVLGGNLETETLQSRHSSLIASEFMDAIPVLVLELLETQIS